MAGTCFPGCGINARPAGSFPPALGAGNLRPWGLLPIFTSSSLWAHRFPVPLSRMPVTSDRGPPAGSHLKRITFLKCPVSKYSDTDPARNVATLRFCDFSLVPPSTLGRGVGAGQVRPGPAPPHLATSPWAASSSGRGVLGSTAQRQVGPPHRSPLPGHPSPCTS